MIALAMLAAALALPAPAGGVTPSQSDTLRDWALARCVARSAPAPFAGDAVRSAAALLERGDAGIETYESIETLVGKTLARRAGGSVPGSYILLQCIELYHDPALARLIASRKATPVR